MCGGKDSSRGRDPMKKVVLTNGTFLNGILHIGEKQFGGGRAGERAQQGLQKI